MKPEKNRHQTSENGPDHPRDQELLADHLMILAENIFGDKSLLMMMDFMTRVVRVVRNDYLTSPCIVESLLISKNLIFILIHFTLKAQRLTLNA